MLYKDNLICVREKKFAIMMLWNQGLCLKESRCNLGRANMNFSDVSSKYCMLERFVFEKIM